jgi:hypothetical protein
VLAAAAAIIGPSRSTSHAYNRVTQDDVVHTLHVNRDMERAPEASFQMARICGRYTSATNSPLALYTAVSTWFNMVAGVRRRQMRAPIRAIVGTAQKFLSPALGSHLR